MGTVVVLNFVEAQRWFIVTNGCVRLQHSEHRRYLHYMSEGLNLLFGSLQGGEPYVGMHATIVKGRRRKQRAARARGSGCRLTSLT